MPIFEYACRKCSREFEQIVMGGAIPECPGCKSRDLDKRLSAFAVQSKGTTPVRSAPREPSGGCGSCGDPRGPGACSMN